MPLKVYEVHYKVGDRDWRYAGEIDASTAAAAVRKFKREGSNRFHFGGKKLRAKIRNPKPARARNGVRTRAANKRKRKNPVKIAATMTGKSTGWMPAKAVRVRVVKGRRVVDVKK